jgi:hypothetical protein
MKAHMMIRKVAVRILAIAAVLGAGTVVQAAPPEALDEAHPHIRAAIAVQHAVTPDWLKEPDVLGTAVGVDNAGRATVVVYVDRDSDSVADTIRALPPQVRGVGVKVEVTDKFRAFAGNTGKQALPVQLGTSGGWSYDLANGYCCGGTLGSLLQVGTTQYILSNYHVLEADIVAGGNGVTANSGDPVIEPGLIDVGCSAPSAQTVGLLVKLGALPGANVDVGLAQVYPGAVNTNGAILGIGTISKTTRSPALRLGVKKSGRTTGLTASTISGLNATIKVAYDNECAGGAAFTKTFTGQIVITNKGSKFLKSGDSGSLMVENVATNPRAVGLLYAGSNTSAIANPIGEVLQFVGGKLGGVATMVGN